MHEGDVAGLVRRTPAFLTLRALVVLALLLTPGLGGVGSPTSTISAAPPTILQAATPGLSAPETVNSGETATIAIAGIEYADLSVDGGYFSVTGEAIFGGVGSGTVEWRAPETASDLIVTFILSDAATGEWLSTAETTVLGATLPKETPTAALDCEPSVSADSAATECPPTVEPAAETSLLTAETETRAPEQSATDESRITASQADEPTAEDEEDEQTEDDADEGTEGTDGTSIEPNPRDVQPAADEEEQQPTQQSDGSDITGSATQTPTPEGDPSDEAKTPRPTRTAEATATTKRSPTPTPTATLAPTNGPNGMVAREIGPDGGELVSPSGATLSIPEGALAEDSSVSIVPVRDTQLPVTPDVELISGTAFDVSVALITSGLSVEELAKPATLRIALTEEQWREGLRIYWINGMELEPVAGATLDESAISAELSHFSRFAAGVAVQTEATSRSPVPFILAAAAVLLVLFGGAGAISIVRRRRPRAVTPRRPRPPLRYR